MAKKKVAKFESAKSKKSEKTTVQRRTTVGNARKELLFGRDTYIWVLAGIGLITLGMLLMLGGNMPSPDVWDESLIYSKRRTLIAPILILAGLLVEVYAIMKK